MSRSLTAMLAFVACAGAAAQSLETQTDWSGGPDFFGPTEHWGARFFERIDAAWRSIPGQLALSSTPRSEGVPHIIADDADKPRTCAVGDMDGDGDVDVVHGDPIASWPDSHGWIYWWERQGDDSWISHAVTNDMYGEHAVETADVDSDGDMDVIAAAYYGDEDQSPEGWRNGRYAWFENVLGDGSAWIKHSVGEMYWGANHIDAGDIDGDGDIDLIGSSELTNGVYEQDGDITWFENLDGEGETWAAHDLETQWQSTQARLGDIDGDGDLDVVGGQDSRLCWWENVDGDATTWTKRVITNELRGYVTVDVGDIDNDHDMDILTAGWNSNGLYWWKNVSGDGTTWIPYGIIGWPSPSSCLLADVDGDGDLDAAWTATSAAHCAENVTGNGLAWDFWEVTYYAELPWMAFGDVNDDGRLDMVVTNEDSTGLLGNQLDWYDVSSFRPEGQLTSSVLDGGAAPTWGAMQWSADTGADATLTVQVRASDDPEDLGPFVAVDESGTDLGELIDPHAQYLQYRLMLRTEDQNVSPIVREISVEAAIAGDVDGDGDVDTEDLLVLLAAWGDCPDPPEDCPADFDGDGDVDTADLLVLLGNWG
jgi:hypothetical protein